jgi:threonine/homoserine/homoserine lactone efflux protein
VAFLPQFISPQGDLSTQLWVLSLTFVILATLNAILHAVFAASARRMLELPSAKRRFNAIGGSLLCGAGAWALLSRRAA